MRKTLFKIYRVLEQSLAPGLKYSQYFYEDVLKEYVTAETKWLDLGCGHQVLPVWRAKEEAVLVSQCREVVGLDYDLESLKNHRSISLRVRGDMSKLPFAPGYFDLATANMVVEHLKEPEVQFQGVSRVLQSGGLFILHTPNSRGYGTIFARIIPDSIKRKLVAVLQDRRSEDVFETFYRANTREKIEQLAKQSGLEVVKIKMIVSAAIFAVVPFLAVFELLWIRLLMTKSLAGWRTNIIAILRKK